MLCSLVYHLPQKYNLIFNERASPQSVAVYGNCKGLTINPDALLLANAKAMEMTMAR
jgi:hypothetical protein